MLVKQVAEDYNQPFQVVVQAKLLLGGILCLIGTNANAHLNTQAQPQPQMLTLTDKQINKYREMHNHTQAHKHIHTLKSLHTSPSPLSLSLS